MRFETLEKQRQARLREAGIQGDHAQPPNDDFSRRHGHVLALGDEEWNLARALRGPAGARRYFADRGIQWWRSPTTGDETPNAPTRNLASSQLSCVNFLLPLATSPGPLTTMLRALDGEVESVSPIRSRNRAGAELETFVELEWIGLGASLEGASSRGANATSIDALLLADLVGGGRRAYLFEWKYVETSGDTYKGDGQAGRTRRDRYDPLYRQSTLFRGPAGEALPERLLYEPFYQLTRFLLLGERMVRTGELGVTEARLVVVCPEGNDAYRNLAPAHAARFGASTGVETAMKEFVVRNPASFAITSQSHLLAAVVATGTHEADEWAGYLRARYGF